MQFISKHFKGLKPLYAAAIVLLTNSLLTAQTIPIVVNDTVRLCEGTAFTLDVLLNDTNDAGEIVEVDILAGPSSPLIDYDDELLPEGTYDIFVDAGFIGEDVMVYEVCGEDDELCAIGLIVIIVAGADNCVWPGDANVDSICNYLDLLPIGVYFGNNGPTRYDIDGTWEESYCDEWEDLVEYLIAPNAKFADCNGDGYIDALDTLVIVNNYGQTHGDYIPAAYIGGPDDPILGVDFFSDTIEAGSEIIIPLLLGTDETPASNIYGLAFEFDYDETLIDASTVKVTFNSGWLGTPGTDLMSIQSNDTINGIISVSVTRINQIARSGSGHVGEVSFVMEDNIAGKLTNEISSPVNFCISFPQTINNFGAPVNINPICDSIIVFQITDGIENYLQNNSRVYPNPADETVNVLLGEKITGNCIMQNIFGQNVAVSQIHNSEKVTFSTKDLAAGTYTITIQTEQTVFTKKIIIQH